MCQLCQKATGITLSLKITFENIYFDTKTGKYSDDL